MDMLIKETQAQPQRKKEFGVNEKNVIQKPKKTKIPDTLPLEEWEEINEVAMTLTKIKFGLTPLAPADSAPPSETSRATSPNNNNNNNNNNNSNNSNKTQHPQVAILEEDDQEEDCSPQSAPSAHILLPEPQQQLNPQAFFDYTSFLPTTFEPQQQQQQQQQQQPQQQLPEHQQQRLSHLQQLIDQDLLKRKTQMRMVGSCHGCGRCKTRVYRYLGVQLPICNACNQHWRRDEQHLHTCFRCGVLADLGADLQLRGSSAGERAKKKAAATAHYIMPFLNQQQQHQQQQQQQQQSFQIDTNNNIFLINNINAGINIGGS